MKVINGHNKVVKQIELKSSSKQNKSSK